MAELSPMMKQYFEIKNKHKDEILFYRLGDFYEMFFDDAITASRELELTLTGRACGLEEKAPMCGVPFHSYESYMARLIAKGYKVAICEQTSAPTGKGIVKRDIIRVVTPGTIIESSMLQDDKNNYICSIYLQGKRAGLCFADISTGTAHTTELASDKIANAILTELCRYQPREVLINETILDQKEITTYLKHKLRCAVELVEQERYSPPYMKELLCDQFGAQWAQTTEIDEKGNVRFAMSALLQYLHDTQKKGVERLKTVRSYTEAEYMNLSPVTRANLELSETMRGREKRGTLLWVLDKTKTAMGKRLLRGWVEQPLVSSALINARLDRVEALYQQTVLRGDIGETLRYVFDMERLMTRIVYGSANPKEIYALAQTCDCLPKLKAFAAECNCEALANLAREIDPLTDIKDRIYSSIRNDPPATLKDGDVILEGFHQEVDMLRDLRNNGRSVLTQLEARLRAETGIPKLKIGYNHVFGYYIEVSNSFKSMVPETYIRKQTLANGERYITQELKELESKILGASERLITLERNLFEELLCALSAELPRIQTTASAVAQLDVAVSLAQVAVDNQYCRPVVDDSNELKIVEGRHPVVEQVLKGIAFIPNDTTLNCSADRCLIITGPNMAGKSTYMRQNALIALMAQIGSFVPAKECHAGVVDAIFTRVGASDDLSAGQSTFMVEMTEVAEILHNATAKSLVILDEIGRGTSTFDGMSIARAVVEHISDTEKGMGCKTLFATHYHELTDLESEMAGVKNYNIAVKKRGEDITFLRQIVRGPADDSYGVEVAKLAGLPTSVTRRARSILKMLEENAPDTTSVEQIGFEGLLGETVQVDPIAKEVLSKLEKIDLDSLTARDALNFLYELKQCTEE
ncbi:MAG: DNA mismatch repair protein MutS [Faecalibacterium sp.]